MRTDETPWLWLSTNKIFPQQGEKRIPLTCVRTLFMVLLFSGTLMALPLTTPYLAFGLEEEDPRILKQNLEVHPAETRWDYHGFQGPRFWGFLEKAYKECRIGHRQSPIDVVMPHHPDHQEELEFQYSQTQFEGVRTEHGIQFLPSATSRLRFNNRNYQLRQFHFHDPSEHHLEGKEFPLEMHLVHADHSGHLLVVALLFTRGIANEELTHILRLGTQFPHSQSAPHSKYDNRALETSDLNLEHLLPDHLHHFSYQGSLTTPPCTQGVQWIVMRTPVQLSPSQLGTLRKLYGFNARPVQQLYNRNIQGY